MYSCIKTYNSVFDFSSSCYKYFDKILIGLLLVLIYVFHKSLQTFLTKFFFLWCRVLPLGRRTIVPFPVLRPVHSFGLKAPANKKKIYNY